MFDMPRRTTAPDQDFQERIVDIDVAAEMRTSFLEYAYSVIYQRALPDARDGLKPVQRRILYSMSEMGLRPDRGHVKSSRVVGEVMGKLHPHGDAAIYDALVRMAQPFSMRLPLVDGHGNFGSPDDAPAAMRYTEARLAPAAMLMVQSIDEETVDFRPNYDGQETEPAVLPAAFPNLLVNGASGIAVGMATNIPPHNLAEVIGAARHLLKKPDATLDELMQFVPGPDLPTGGLIIGLDAIREAYETGRGTFRMRARATIENVTARRKAIVVTELPFNVGPERVVAKIKELVQAKKLVGIADLKDLTDRHKGLRLVIEVKTGFNPEAVLEELYRLTPMEETFGINSVALVDGQPRTLGLRDLLAVYVNHRLEVVRRRSAYRLRKREERLHLVEGLITALLNIDEVIQVIRTSDDPAHARSRLMETFGLSEAQAGYILDTPLRRLTRYDKLELEREKEELQAEIAELNAILGSEDRLRRVVSKELAEVAKKYGTPRRTQLLDSAEAALKTAIPLEVADDPCLVLLSSTGLIARTADASPLPGDGPRAPHDVLVSAVRTTVRGEVGVITSKGRMIRVSVVELPTLPASGDPPSLAGAQPVTEYVTLEPDEHVVGLGSLDEAGHGIALGTAQGVVKRVAPDYPVNRDDFEIISLREGDRVVGAVELESPDHDLVFITSDAQLLRFPAATVRPQGRPAGGVAGIRLAEGARVIWFGAVDPARESRVVTVAGSSTALPGTQTGTVKVSDYAVFPPKGRATGGVRAQRFLKGEDVLLLAWAGPAPAKAISPSGQPVELPAELGRRDGSGTRLMHRIAAIGGAIGAAPPARPAEDRAEEAAPAPDAGTAE
ncbi:DNA topoisomerase (ATP-hydrolyzing) [Thermobispora bispora]|jgi:DNA gyrase subunit A|uniref:DNA gyrase/topoisomerase IV subunit A n=1 Tax=Thermobispora bispora TaxID=2006 RepID=UPI0019813DA9|nr:DNA topoisomerase IV subunit A [Thermobispora bispora]MBO2474352.1 DNA topoisomerase IV [Actinomycetales bacterium]MBX6167481.1 DNA topoisomerase IV subunit A [Thermobispora bispora]QSI48810.1 DNA topoisomerase IV subunit A [Thermobispora bispora]